MGRFSIGSLAEAAAEMEKGVMDFTKDGQCSGCGSCCSNFLPLSRGEIRDIRRYVEKHHIKEHVHSGAPLSEPLWDLTCPFLDISKPTNRCTIYSHRPYICRAFMCNRPPEETTRQKWEFLRQHDPVDMRATFFGGNSGKRGDGK